MKKIAVLTGATGGLGKEFIKLLLKENIDEIWAVARNKEKLSRLCKQYGSKISAVPCDLSDERNISELSTLINKEKPDIRILINNAGIAKMGCYDQFTDKEISQSIDTNCKAAVLLCQYALPYMKKGARIINISSASSFQPTPYINLYAAGKVFLRSYSRSLNFELKNRGITCTAVCPGWIDTDMLPKTKNGRKIRYPGIVTAKAVAEKAMNDSKKGKDMSVCSLYVKYEHLFSKIMPQKLVMKIWTAGIKKYIK